MKRLLLLCALLCVCGAADAQSGAAISGRVLDAATGGILPYATVSVRGKNIGMISDREGRFELRAGENLSPTDSVIFSHVGFDARTYAVGELTGAGRDISLRRGEYEIEQIVVTNRRSRLAKLGHSSSGTGMFQAGWIAGHNPDDPARTPAAGETRVNREGGVPIKIGRDSEILSFGMFIRRNGYDRALFRLSFYSLDGDTPGELIVHKDIRFEIKDRVTGRFETDLSQYGIRFSGGQEILVTLTLLEDEMDTDNPEAFTLDGALLGKGVYHRDIGSETWDRFGGATITMYLNARTYM